MRSLLPALRRDPRLQPWTTLSGGPARPAAVCVICGWRGARFDGFAHCESALCPSCGSISRDRYRVNAPAQGNAAEGALPGGLKRPRWRK